MNVTFKTIRRSGDKLYVLSEISGYDERLPVVLAASTGSGERIPSDTFPYCDIEDSLALQQVLFDGALAGRGEPLPPVHTKNSADVRFFVVVLPWLEVYRWVLEFQAMDSHGNVISSCKKSLDAMTSSLKSMTALRTSPTASALMEDLDGRFIHDRVHVRFERVLECGDEVLVSARVEMPFHEESVIEFDFLDRHGHPLSLHYDVVEDSVSQPHDFGALRRRSLVVSFRVSREHPQVCLCATDTQGTIAPGFAMLGESTFEGLIERFHELTTSAYDDEAYHEWYVSRHRADVPVLLEQVSTRFAYEPLFSIVCVLADTPLHHLHDLFNSIAQQSYGRWELILVDVDGDQAAASRIKEAFDEERVYVLDVGMQRGYDECFATGLAAAEGDFVVMMRPCDIMAPDTLFECVRTLNEFADCDVLYTDVDTVDAQGVHSRPLFRTTFSPELLRSCDYMRDMLIVRATLLVEALPPSFSPLGPSTYDLSLRLAETARRICHVPRVLCHRRFATMEAEDARLTRFEQEAGRRALMEHCKRVGLSAEVLSTDVTGHYRVRHVLVDTPQVSIVLFSYGSIDMLAACVRSLYERVSYPDFEVVVVDAFGLAQSEPERMGILERSYQGLSVLGWEGPATRGAMANYAAHRTHGEFILFMSDNTRILSEDAVQTMLGYFQMPDVGVVGPKQLYVDGTIEHAGIIVGGTHAVTPLFRHMPGNWQGYLGRAALAQNVTAVTGDCMMVRRSAFVAAGEFNEEFALFYADVDFCLHAREQGFYTVFTPYVEMGRSHSVATVQTLSRRLRIHMKREAALLQAAWPQCFAEGDPFHNPNLDPDSSYFALRRAGL